MKPKSPEKKKNFTRIVTPGDVIKDEAHNYLRGHGTYELGGKLRSSLCGRVERVNKLITVSPLKQRYTGEVGDLVVGRVVSVESNFWKMDIQSKSCGRLQLSSINLDGLQRRKTFQDQLKMRELYKENDVIVAEVQQILFNNVCSLQTRSVKYGKLTNGCFVSVNCGLIKSCKKHFHTFSFGVQLVLGKNGYIWIELASKNTGNSFYERKVVAKEHKKVDVKGREKICRVRNSILALEDQKIQIYPETIKDVIESSSAMLPKEMMENTDLITAKARKRIEKVNFQDLMDLDDDDEEEFSFKV